MMGIQRYEWDSHLNEDSGAMARQVDGDYVLYSDHIEQLAELREVVRELVLRCEECHKIRGQRTVCDGCEKALELVGGLIDINTEKEQPQ